VPRLVAAFAVVVALVGCQGGSGADERSTGTTKPPVGTTESVDTGSPTCRLPVSAEPRSLPGPAATSYLVDAMAGKNGCVDQVIFQFEPAGDGTPPGYQIEYHDAEKEPFLDGDPPTAISVEGSAWLLVKLGPAASAVAPADPEAKPVTKYLGPLSVHYDSFIHLQQVRKLPDATLPDGTAQVVWAIGLDGQRPFAVDAVSDPPRVTVYIS
jgi:hypothetical protein